VTSNNRLWVIGSVIAMFALVLAGWFLGAQPFLATALNAEAERANVEAQNQLHQQVITQLAQDQQNLKALKKKFATLAASIPSDPDTSEFITGLDALAAGAGVTISGITVSDSEAYTVPVSAGQPPADTSTSAPSTAATATAVPVDPSLPKAVTNPLITAENFVGIKVTVSVVGPYSNVLNFVHGLQYGDRLVLVTGFTSTTTADENAVDAVVSGYIYVLQQG
jgi:type IV pilus assembly PilO-like protein